MRPLRRGGAAHRRQEHRGENREGPQSQQHESSDGWARQERQARPGVGERPADGQPAAPDFPRLYGPPGWTVRIGLWRLLEPWLDTPRCLPGESPLRLDARGGPVSDYVPFRGMDAATAADLSALAAADTLRGLSEGEPCANAARIAQENGANLAACTEPSRPDTMDVRVSVPITGPFAFLGDAKGQARAGAPDDTGDE